MANLYRKALDGITLGCYSERGIMSFFMFRVLPTRLRDFLDSIEFARDVPNPLRGLDNLADVTLFSELDFGNKGFGKPDGAIFFRHGGRAFFILIEVKLNQTYQQACGPNASYNSTIRGQLELKWRLMKSYTTGQVQPFLGVSYVFESDPFITFYRQNDPYYRSVTTLTDLGLDRRRRLRLVQGVGTIFNDYVAHCPFDNIFYLAATGDRINPLNHQPGLMPRCCDERGQEVPEGRRQFCWINKDILTGWA